MASPVSPEGVMPIDNAQDAEKGTPGQTRASYSAAGEVEDIDLGKFYGDSTSKAYRLKSEIIGRCIQESGFGRFQIELFVVAGLVWGVDNFATQGIASTQPPIELEFSDISTVSNSSVAFYVGLILGASFWGISSDFIGRKVAFRTTTLLCGIFLCAAAGSRNFIAFSSLWAVIGFAAGGNVPTDSLIFLEYLPASHQWLLTALSSWWNLGQLVVSLLAWVYLANFSCPQGSTPETCHLKDNMGWRYTLITLGGLALMIALISNLAFKLPETPRYLLSRGRDEEAVAAVNYVARRNGKPEVLTLDMLRAIDADIPGNSLCGTVQGNGLSSRAILRESLKDLNTSHFKALFANRKLGFHTSLTWFLWLTVGIAYPLFQNFLPSYLETRFTQDSSLSTTYRNYCITSAVGLAGPLSASYFVSTRFGRRWVMGISALVTGAFLFAYVSVDSPSSSLAFSCVTTLVSNFQYSILYAFTPESFPAPHRGTGTGTASALLRLGGLIASIIASRTGFTTAPLYVSAALWLVVGVSCFALPFETQKHAAI